MGIFTFDISTLIIFHFLAVAVPRGVFSTKLFNFFITTSVMGSHDSCQSFEKTACCGKVSHRVANTVIYLCGGTGLILPRGPKSLQAHLQPASAVKFMR